MVPNPRFHQIVNAAKQNVRECTIQDVQARQAGGETFQIIDVREESEWAKGHVPGAVHVGRGVLERDIEAQVPDAAAELVLYCGGGSRSALAADTLQRMGYTNVWSLQGGFKSWKEAGLPTEN